jgi:hypothetical protein
LAIKRNFFHSHPLKLIILVDEDKFGSLGLFGNGKVCAVTREIAFIMTRFLCVCITVWGELKFSALMSFNFPRMSCALVIIAGYRVAAAAARLF